MIRFLLPLVALLAVLPQPVTGQSQTAEFVLTELRMVNDLQEYHYVLHNRGLREYALVDVYLDISAPRGDELPPLLEMSGEFLMDAFTVRRDITDAGRPDLGISTPEPWSAAIYIDGTVSWGSPRFFGSASGGVEEGQSLSGFALRSSAVPALRRYEIEPFYTLEMQQRAEAAGEPAPRWSGWTIGPGWPQDLVNVSFVEDQYRMACSLGLLAEAVCDEVDRHMAPLIIATGEGDVQAYRSGLQGLARIARHAKVSAQVRDVLLAGVAAALAQPPALH